MPRQEATIPIDKDEVKLIHGCNRSLGRQTGHLVVIAEILPGERQRGGVPHAGRTVYSLYIRSM